MAMSLKLPSNHAQRGMTMRLANVRYSARSVRRVSGRAGIRWREGLSPSACNFNRMSGWTRPVGSIGTSQPVGVNARD